MAKKKKELVIVPDEPLTPVQKGILAAMISFVPFFIFVILPMLTRNHILGSMNMSPEILLSQPVPVNLVRTGQPVATYKVAIRHMELKIPRDYLPVTINPTLAVFRRGNRKMFRTISFGSYPKAKKVDLSETGIIGWLVPGELKNFLEVVLRATWHPARLMCKAQFFVTQGINSQIFEIVIDDDHKAFIFPLSGNSGYLGRIFSKSTDDYVELALSDEVDSPTLRDWVDLATQLTPLYPKENQLPEPYNGLSLADAIERGNLPNDSQWQVVENSLNRYFTTGSNTWLLPLVEVLESRGYFREVIDFYRLYSPGPREDQSLAERWQESLDRAVRQNFKMELDPHIQLNKLVGFCENLGEFTLGRVKLKIIFPLRSGEKSFKTELFAFNPLHGGQNRAIEIEPPPGISVRIASEVRWKILDIDIKD